MHVFYVTRLVFTLPVLLTCACQIRLSLTADIVCLTNNVVTRGRGGSPRVTPELNKKFSG